MAKLRILGSQTRPTPLSRLRELVLAQNPKQGGVETVDYCSD